MPIEYFEDGLSVVPSWPTTGITVTSAAAAHTYGAYIEFIASTGEALYVVGVSTLTSGIAYGIYQIATGAAGAEVVKATLKCNYSATIGTLTHNMSLRIPLRIPVGVRVAVRAADESTSALNHTFSLFTLPVAKCASPVLDEVIHPKFLVVSDGGNSPTQVKTDRTEATTDHWMAPALVRVLTGALAGQVKRITGYNGTTKVLFFDAFTSTPAAGVQMEIVNQ